MKREDYSPEAMKALLEYIKELLSNKLMIFFIIATTL